SGCSPLFGVVRAASERGCGDSRTSCNGACVDLSSDSAHCGACDIRCGVAETCTDAVCDTENSTGTWTFALESAVDLTVTAEVRTKPDWVQRVIFTEFPASFQIRGFDPGVQTLVIQWPATSPDHWLCQGAGVLNGKSTATDPEGAGWI